jgi:hypothetical protein
MTKLILAARDIHVLIEALNLASFDAESSRMSALSMDDREDERKKRKERDEYERVRRKIRTQISGQQQLSAKEFP